ncbi:MAG: hypothetical protein L6V91_01660 [Bacilli bacterium]|nr:MAG: hypothetical protein L6V91_01660 [Bacilli bacterium]
MKNRSDIDKKYTWDLDVIYSDMSSFDKDYDKAKKLIKKLGSFEKKMIINSSNFFIRLLSYILILIELLLSYLFILVCLLIWILLIIVNKNLVRRYLI